MDSDKLEGNTLNVYAFIVRADDFVGLREITRGVGLSSSSVVYYHLQKLENLGLVEKNSYGQYSLKEKALVDGYMWVGKNLVPRLMFYAFFFIGLFTVAVSIILFDSIIRGMAIDARFLFLVGTILLATLLFLIEGLALYRKLNPKCTNKNYSKSK